MVGYFSIAIGVIATLVGILLLLQGNFTVISQGVTAFLIGYWTLNASKSFLLIVQTKGTDIELLMNAVADMRRLYTLQYWLLIIGLVFLLLFSGLTAFASVTDLMTQIGAQTRP